MDTGSKNLADTIEFSIRKWQGILSLTVGCGAIIGGVFATFQTIEKAAAFEAKTNQRIQRLEKNVNDNGMILCSLAADLSPKTASKYCGAIIKSQGR